MNDTPDGGEGGQLPAHKVTDLIARLRHIKDPGPIADAVLATRERYARGRPLQVVK